MTPQKKKIEGPKVKNSTEISAAIPSSPFPSLSDRYRAEGKDLEKRGDFYGASGKWRIVAALNPEDQEAAARMNQTAEKALEKAKTHFKAGRIFFKEKDMRKARREFLLTLAQKPEHSKALHYLKSRLNEEGLVSYEASKGKNLREISEEIYGDPSYGFLIAYFNDMEDGKIPQTGSVLTFPTLEGIITMPSPEAESEPTGSKPEQLMVKISEIDRMLEEAKGHLNSSRYGEALKCVRKVLAKDEKNDLALSPGQSHQNFLKNSRLHE